MRLREYIFRFLKSWNWESAKSWNWKGIGIAVFVSTSVWFFNALNKPYNTQIAYPIRFTHAQDDLVALVPPPEQINLEITGQGWELLRISLGFQIEPLTMRIKNPLKTNYMLSRILQRTIAENLSEVKINYIQNDTIHFDYDYIATKEVFLKARRREISLAKNYRIVSPIFIQPQKIFFTGASRLINQLPDTLHIKIPEQNISENFKEIIDFDYPTNNFLQPSSKKILVSFEVKEFEEKSISLPVTLHNFPKDSSFYILQREAEIRFLKKKDEPLVTEGLNLLADFANISWKDSTLTPFLDFNAADSIFEIRILPPKFKVYAKNPQNRHHRRNRDR